MFDELKPPKEPDQVNVSFGTLLKQKNLHEDSVAIAELPRALIKALTRKVSDNTNKPRRGTYFQGNEDFATNNSPLDERGLATFGVENYGIAGLDDRFDVLARYS